MRPSDRSVLSSHTPPLCPRPDRSSRIPSARRQRPGPSPGRNRSAPYGGEEGDVVINTCFQGFRAPHLIEPATERLETLAFSDWYDPQGTKGVALLLINTAAIWCGPCLAEHEALDERAAAYAPRGLAILSTLFQDAEGLPAKESDLVNWVNGFGTNFPMAIDPEYLMDSYARAQTAPLNMVVDPRSMTILRKFFG